MTSIQNNGNDSIGAAGNCAVCDQPSGLKCSNCTKAHYCSKEHQKQHWKIHKQICFPFEVSRLITQFITQFPINYIC